MVLRLTARLACRLCSNIVASLAKAERDGMSDADHPENGVLFARLFTAGAAPRL
jgi:hypothetical protein